MSKSKNSFSLFVDCFRECFSALLDEQPVFCLLCPLIMNYSPYLSKMLTTDVDEDRGKFCCVFLCLEVRTNFLFLYTSSVFYVFFKVINIGVMTSLI